MDVAVWRRAFEANLFGYAVAGCPVIPHLLAQGGGTVINTSSGTAWISEPEHPAYGASKAAINSLTQHIASAWGKHGIRANAVAPGVTMTEYAQKTTSAEFQAGILATTCGLRLGTPADVAAATAFLLSDNAGWGNGQAWSLDCGMTIRG